MTLVCLAFLLCAQAAHAQAAHATVGLPPVNLGFSSFEDGIGYPGWIVEEFFSYYHADQFNDSRGEKISGSNRLTTLSAITHVGYLSELHLFGASYGGEVILPLANVDINASSVATERIRGVGDLFVGPFVLQWSDQKLFGMGYFHRFVIDLILPTGEYDRNKAVNIGNNLISVTPNYALTLVASEKLEFSARLNYLWNSQNDEPFVGLGARNTQPGQAFFANYSVSYEIFKGGRIGINGYALQQFTENKIDGHSLVNSKERVFAIGPGLVFRRNKLWIYLNGYFETLAENRPQGIKVVFRISKAF